MRVIKLSVEKLQAEIALAEKERNIKKLEFKNSLNISFYFTALDIEEVKSFNVYVDDSELKTLENNIKTSVFTDSKSFDPVIFSENSEEEYPKYLGIKTKINIDPEEKLSALPFITKQLVRKIILERELGSGFRNTDDLRNKLGLSDRNARILAQRIDFSFKNKK